MILYDWFSTTAKILKHSTTKEYVLCVCMLDREGRTLGVSSTAVVLDNIYIFLVWTAVCLTRYNDYLSNYLTGFHEPLSTSYLSHWFENCVA